MNFDVYKINKIFYDNIAYLSSPRKYGFDFCGEWYSPRDDEYFDIYLASEDADNWIHAPSLSYPIGSYYTLNHYSIYKIDNHYFLREGGWINLYFLIRGKDAQVSLRELVLFMIYMKYISSKY